MSMGKKRANDQTAKHDGEDCPQKKSRSHKMGETLDAMDDLRDSEDDPGHSTSQSDNPHARTSIVEPNGLTHGANRRFLALTRRKSAAKSDEILDDFKKVLEDRKTETLNLIGEQADAIKANEFELRKLTVAILAELSPISKGDESGANMRPGSSTFAFTEKLLHNKRAALSASKAFLKDYRRISQEIAAAAREEQIAVEHPSDNDGEHLRLLLEKQGKRLRGEIHAMLDGEDKIASEDRYDAPAEEELWTRFGGANAGESGKPTSHWNTGEGWTRTVQTSRKAVGRLVECLPEE